MNISEINSAIIRGQFSNDDLTSIIDAVKYARSKLTSKVTRSLRVGDTVSFVGRGGRTVVGSVTGVKIKNVIVKEGFTSWKVPAAMLTLVE